MIRVADTRASLILALKNDKNSARRPRQIGGKKYDATFRAEGITDIEKIGLAYFKDRVELCKEKSTVHK